MQTITPPLTDQEIDDALGPIARAMPSKADLILDIRAAARERKHPGSCVRCFFQLAASARQTGSLEPLRAWLEQNIQVVAHGVEKVDSTDEEKRELERLPLVLDGDTLENYCQDLLERFHHDRAYSADRVEMEFQYR